MDELSFGSLLYRYFFYGWLFKDVNRGNLFERAAAWRHNQDQSRWLPCYARRWVVMGLTLFALGALVEFVLGSPVLSAFFYVPSVLSVPMTASLAVAQIAFKVLSGPL